MNKRMRFSVFVALTIAALASALASATPLNLTLSDSPDIVSAFIEVDYNAGSNQLTANGFSLNLFDGSVNPIAGGLFSLNATIDNAGNLISGALSISGTIAALGFNSGTLLTGSLSAVGSNTVGGLLEFVFDVTGGDAAALFGDIAGLIMGDTGFSDWGLDFASSTASADAAPLPAAEPSMLLLQAMGILLLGVVGLRSRRRSAD